MFHSPEQGSMVGVDDEDDDESVDIFFCAVYNTNVHTM